MMFLHCRQQCVLMQPMPTVCLVHGVVSLQMTPVFALVPALMATLALTHVPVLWPVAWSQILPLTWRHHRELYVYLVYLVQV